MGETAAGSFAAASAFRQTELGTAAVPDAIPRTAAPPGQPVQQPLPGLGKPGGQRPDLPPKLPGRVLLLPALEAAQDERQAQLLR